MIIYYSLPKDVQKEFNSGLDSIIIGRKPKPGQSVDLDLIQDEFVSHQHSRISFENGHYWIEDMDSGNGTWINDEIIREKTRLTATDRIRIGYTEMTVHMDSTDEDSDLECMHDLYDATLISEPESVTEISGMDDKTRISDTADPMEFETFDDVTIVNIQEETPDDETIVDFSAASHAHGIASDEKTSEDKPDLPYSRLKMFNDFCSELETVKGYEALALVFSQKLQIMIPNAQRGAILSLDEQHGLKLKATWPAGKYTDRETWCQEALDRCEAFIRSYREDNANKDPVRSAIYLPLLIRTKAIGVIYVDTHYIPGIFSLTDLELMKAVANHVAIFVNNLYQ